MKGKKRNERKGEKGKKCRESARKIDKTRRASK